MIVEEVLLEWKEQGQRARRWFVQDDVSEQIGESDLLRLWLEWTSDRERMESLKKMALRDNQ